MAGYRRKYWWCFKANCDLKKRVFVRKGWWHTWIEHKQFLCLHCTPDVYFDTFEDYDNHLSQHNDSDEATERRQSSIGTSDPTEQPSTSNPTENVPAADPWSPFTEMLMTDEMQDWLLYGFTVADVLNLNETENVPAADRRSPFAALPMTDEMRDWLLYGFTVADVLNLNETENVPAADRRSPSAEISITDKIRDWLLSGFTGEDVQKVDEPHDCGYPPKSGLSPVPSASKSSAIDKSKKIICIYPTCNWRDIERELSMHISVEHLPRKGKRSSKFVCMVCKLVLIWVVDLWWHYLKVHREYSCHECEDLFSPVDTYYEHRLAHENNKIVAKDQYELEPQPVLGTFKCPYIFCVKRGDKETVKVHIRDVHLLKNDKKCLLCPDKKITYLWSHYWIVHGALICEFCHAKFRLYKFYIEHRQTCDRSKLCNPNQGRDGSTFDVNVGASTSDVNVGASTSDVNVGASTSDVNVGASTSDVNVGASTSDVNVGASTSEGPPQKLQKPF